MAGSDARDMATTMRRRQRHWLRGWHATAWIAFTAGALALLALFGPPFLLRGPVLVALARRESRSLCGTVGLKGGHVGMNAMIALIRQRPFDVALDGVRIREPEGHELFHARSLRLRLALLRRPWRLVVERASISDGAWALLNEPEGVAATVALERIPAAGRSACHAPAPPSPQAAPPTIGPLITVKAVTLRNVSLVLAFDEWAVKLDALDAHGTLEVRGTPAGQQFLFDARDIRTDQGGSLRIGPAHSQRTLEIPFDRVAISRVAVTDSAPLDLRLVVDQARTRAAVLSGRAAFTNVFAPDSSHLPAGMDLDARWKNIGQALEADPPWTDVGRRLTLMRADARASLHGPFDALIGSVALAGKGVSLQARLLPEQRYTLGAVFHALDTRPLLARAQRAWLGGRLDGHLSVSARLGPGPKDQSIALDDLALALRRSQAGPDSAPRRWVIERSSANHGSLRMSATDDDLVIKLGDVVWQRGVATVDPFEVRAPGVAIAGSFRGGDATGLRLRARFSRDSHVTWQGETFELPPQLNIDRNADSDLAIAPFVVRNATGGTIEVGGSIHHDGPIDLTATVADYPLAHLPGIAAARVPGQSASVAQLLAGHVDATLNVNGTERAPSVSGRLALSDVWWADHRLGGGAIVFDGIPGGTRFQGRLLDGIDTRGQLTRQMGAADYVAIALHDLTLEPWLPRSTAALKLRASGDAVWHPHDRATGVALTAGDVVLRGVGVDAHATARLQPRHREANLQAHVALAPLRTALPALRTRSASGAIAADLRWRSDGDGNPPRIDGTIAWPAPLSIWPAGLPAPIEIRPSRVTLHDNDIRVAGTVARTAGAQGTLAGKLHVDWSDLGQSALAGTVHLAIDGGKLTPGLAAGAGADAGGGGSADFGATLTGPVRALLLHGQARFQALTVDWPGSPVGSIRLDGPLAIDGPIDGPRFTVGPLLARLQSGGWILVAGARGPGRFDLAPRRSPLPIDHIDLLVRGAGLSTTRPIGGASIRGLALALRFSERQNQIVRVTGSVHTGHTVYRLASSHQSQPPSKTAPRGAKKRRAGPLDHIWADNIQVIGPRDAVKASVPFAPTVTVGLRCVVDGALVSPHVSGRVEGDGLYSRVALAIADWFTSRNLRECDFGPN